MDYLSMSPNLWKQKDEYRLHVKYDPKYNDRRKNKKDATFKLTDLKMHF